MASEKGDCLQESKGGVTFTAEQLGEIGANHFYGMNYQTSVNEIDLGDVFLQLWKGKWLIVFVAMLISVGTVFYSLTLPNEYKSQILLAPITDSSKAGGLSSLVSKFGGLASMAGINIAGVADKTTLAIEMIKSRSFIIDFINKHDLLVPLMAAEGWDLANNKLLIDDELYDLAANKWIRTVSPPKKVIPTGLEAYDEFFERLDLHKDNDSGYITIGFTFYSPIIAKEWLELLVHQLNDAIRLNDVNEAEETMAFLNKQIEENPNAEMRQLMYNLIETQMQTIVLANVREEYVLRTVDRAMIPDEKDGPKRAIIVILAGFFGGILGCIIVLIHFSKLEKYNKQHQN